MHTSEVLNRAADLIEERGWTKGDGWHSFRDETKPLCLEGGLYAAAGWNRRSPAFRAVVDYLTTTRPEHINPHHHGGEVIPFSWNDAPGRTATEVIAVLRATALIEAAREEQDAAWETYAEVVTA